MKELVEFGVDDEPLAGWREPITDQAGNPSYRWYTEAGYEWSDGHIEWFRLIPSDSPKSKQLAEKLGLGSSGGSS